MGYGSIDFAGCAVGQNRGMMASSRDSTSTASTIRLVAFGPHPKSTNQMGAAAAGAYICNIAGIDAGPPSFSSGFP